MIRREFITLLGGAAAWPLAARAQQGERMWRIDDENNPLPKTFVSAFTQALADLGWTDGRNASRVSRRIGHQPRPRRPSSLASPTQSPS